MPEKQASPFSGLDKALLRSTQPAQPRVEDVPPEAAIEDEPPRAGQPPHRSTASKKAPVVASTSASTLASIPASVEAEMVQSIRKVIRTPGREVSFVRLTPEEKGQLADLVYTYKRQGVKTSENEINRIAVNYMLMDYRENGERSMLAQVIAALLA